MSKTALKKEQPNLTKGQLLAQILDLYSKNDKPNISKVLNFGNINNK